MMENEMSWFAESGPDDDIVISTRARIIRNLADFPFPSKMSDDDRERVQTLVKDAFQKDEKWYFSPFEQFSEQGKEILRDKNILRKKDCSAVIVDYSDESTCALVNETDHIKISSFTAGLDCEKVMKKVYKVDEFLQDKLQFAANIDFGYLTSHIKDCGSGLKFSIRVFIPSIVLAGKIDTIISFVQSNSLSIIPVFKAGDIANFSNCIFDICTFSSAQGNEFDQMANIQAAGELILKTERKIRQQFADNNQTIALNFFKQSYAKAVYSLLLSYEEAVDIISAVKWGLQLNIIKGISEKELNALYFRTKNGHLRYLCDNFSFSFEDDVKQSIDLQIKRLRTIIIQQAFEGIVNEKSDS